MLQSKQLLVLPVKTISNFYHRCRFVVLNAYHIKPIKLGGDNVIIQIDESFAASLDE